MEHLRKFGTFPICYIEPNAQTILVNHDAFVFVDHRGRAVEYVLPNPKSLYTCTEPISVPVGVEELQTAVIELETICAVADVYHTSVSSIMTRIQGHNLSDKLNPIIPSKEYLQTQETNAAHGDVYISHLAHQWGVTTSVMSLWLSEYT